MILRFLIYVSLFLTFCPLAESSEKVKGIWVECEGTNETLSTPKKLQEMAEISGATGVNTIFLQVHRHNRSWYNSSLADTTPYNLIKSKYNIDPLDYAIKEAHKRGIKIHAWINIFRIGKDINAPVIKKLGREVITRDGRGRSLIDYPNNKLPDGGYWLDPGDLTARAYLLDIIKEILQKYPEIDGIHMDYIRYPYTDINPGSRFSDHKDLGYGKASIERFISKYGFSPLKMDLTDRNKTQKWDDWRRGAVTDFVEEVYKLCKSVNPKIQVSCAVQPWTDRAYLTAYQDWHSWLKKGIVDFVVIMNYSTDRKLARYLSAAAIAVKSNPPAYIGLGAYLMLKSQLKLYLQIKDCQNLGAKGIILFSYDALLKNRNIFKNIAKNKWWE